MKSFRVLAAHHNEEHDRMEVVKEITEDDGTTWLNLHIFSTETLEWRAAEYGISDHDELVDLVLHEPFIEDVEPLRKGIGEARTLVATRVAEVKAKYSSKVVKNKAEHKSRLRTAGVDQKYIDAVDNDPLDVIKQHCKIDPNVLKEKQAHVKETRRELASGQSVEVVNRSQVLRQALSGLRKERATGESGDTRVGALPPISLEGKKRNR